MTHQKHEPRPRVGRRGIVLGLFGAAWVLQGLAVLLLGWHGGTHHMIHEAIPQAVYAACWIVPGLIGMGAAVRRRRRYDDTVGFIAVTIMPLFLTTSYGVGAVTTFLNPHVPNKIALLGLLGFSTWGVVAAALALIASWPEPPAAPGGSDCE